MSDSPSLPGELQPQIRARRQQRVNESCVFKATPNRARNQGFTKIHGKLLKLSSAAAYAFLGGGGRGQHGNLMFEFSALWGRARGVRPAISSI